MSSQILKLVGSSNIFHHLGKRSVHFTACCQKNVRAGVPKITNNRSKTLTYEEAGRPYDIGVKKGWNSWNTSNLFEELDRTAETTVEDILIRRFMTGTWHNLLASEVVVKRRLNLIILAGLVTQQIHPRKLYFLKGYTEEFLSHYLRRPVRVEIQTIKHRNDMIFKRI